MPKARPRQGRRRLPRKGEGWLFLRNEKNAILSYRRFDKSLFCGSLESCPTPQHPQAATLARDALKDEREQLENKQKQLSEDASLVAFVAKKVMDRERELEVITAGLVQPQAHDYMADLDAVENYRSSKEYGNGLGY